MEITIGKAKATTTRIKTENKWTLVMTEPTERGKEEYAETGGYYEELPCTCKQDCSSGCKGECGCHACNAAYYDAISWD